jgi:amino acid adenylation domain-containing protein
MTQTLAPAFSQKLSREAPAGLAPTSLVTLFEETAQQRADKVAILCGADQLTYAELNAEANRIAHQLLQLGLPRQSIVAIWLDRSNGMIAAMLGVLKAGHIYLPLEATYPEARIAQTLEDALPAVLITHPALASTLPLQTAYLLFPALHMAAPEINPILATTQSDVAYLMYTSGSTGKPKAVRVTHTNVLRLIDNTRDFFAFDVRDVWTMFHSFAFDFSVWEIWGPLLTGAKLVIVPFETTRSPEDFYRLLVTERVTVLNHTPSAFALLNHVEEQGMLLPLSLRLVIFGGEALKFSSLRSWFARHGDARPRLVNCYGITETTVHVTMRPVTQADAEREQDSLIGEPIADLQIHLLDPAGLRVPEGEPGEICVSGAGVSLGYLNRPQLTAERFVSDPFTDPHTNPRRLMYRSGDLARRRADGELVYIGRRDEQVKISGFRVELGEVEAAVAQFPGVTQSCVIPHTEGSGRTQLAAFFVEDGRTPIAIPQLAHFLARQLPAQMLPAFYTRLTHLPLTPNGKVDRRALPTPSHDILEPRLNQEKACTEIQDAVLALVRRMTGMPGIGLDDNFFMVGGHSLLGTRFVLSAREAFGIKISLRDIFEAETIADLAQRIEQLILDDIHALTEEEALQLAAPTERLA